MRKLFFLFLLPGLMSSCKYFEKHENGIAVEATADSLLAGPMGEHNQMVAPDTMTLKEKLFHLDSITEAEFKSAAETGPDTNKVPEVVQTDYGLRFTLTNGDTLLLKNTDDFDTATGVSGEGVTHYFYGANFTTSDYWLAEVNFYEGGSNILVNKKNGKQAACVGYPQLSPDKKFIASGQYDLSGESGSGLDLYKIGRDSLELIFSADPGWGPDAVRWKDNHTLYLKQGYWINGSQQATRYAKLDLTPLNLAQ